MTNGIQIYQILELFAIYSLLGWVCSIMYAALTEKDRKDHRICKGPYCPAYGFGGFAVSAGAYFFASTPIAGVASGVVIGTVAELITVAIVNGTGGEKIISYKWYHSIFWGALGTILVYHLNPVFMKMMIGLPVWFNLTFLLVFWTAMLSNFIDGLWNLAQKKKQNHQTTEQ